MYSTGGQHFVSINVLKCKCLFSFCNRVDHRVQKNAVVLILQSTSIKLVVVGVLAVHISALKMEKKCNN